MWLLFEHLVQVPPVPHRFPKPAQEGLAYLFHVPWWCTCIFTVSPLLDCTPSHGHCVSFTFWSLTLSAVWFTASIQWACIVAVVQSLNHVHLFATPWTADQASLSFIISQSLLRLMPIESVMPSNHLVLCHPLLPLLSIFPSVWVFSNESVLHHQVAKVLEFQLQHQSFQWIFIQDWFPLGLTGLISLQSKGLSRVFSRTTIRKHQLFGAQPSLWSNSHICTWPVEKS